MNPNRPNPRWILEWRDDSGDSDHDIREIADSIEEARTAIQRILTGVTWTPEDAEEYGGDQTEQAYTALVREEFKGDILAGLRRIADQGIAFRCDDGTLVLERER